MSKISYQESEACAVVRESKESASASAIGYLITSLCGSISLSPIGIFRLA
jgi:hypothetical protein